MLFFVALKLVALGFAFVASIRARFTLGVALVVVVLYATMATGLRSIPPHVELPFAQALASIWWLLPLGATTASVVGTVIAFRAVDGERERPVRHQHLERAGFAFLANAILDGCLLVVLTFAHVLAAKDMF